MGRHSKKIRPAIQQLQPYQGGMSIDELARTYQLDPATIIKLASNENPYGPAPASRTAIDQVASELHRYPDTHALTTALAKHHAVSPETIILGNGSNDILDLIARLYLSVGREAVSSEYAFLVYGLATTLSDATNVVVPSRDYGHDLEAMRSAITDQTAVIWIANPNNPTGTVLDNQQLESFIKSVPTDIMIVLDEAYYEYLDPAQAPASITWLAHHPNLIITRTFSKIYGLAGLRIGYGIGDPSAIELLNRIRQPFNMNSMAIAAAVAALEDETFVTESRQHNREAYLQLTQMLDQLHIKYIPSAANFVTIEVTDPAMLHEQLLQRGIIVRPLVNYGLANHLRITLGTAQEMDRLVTALTDFMRA